MQITQTECPTFCTLQQVAKNLTGGNSNMSLSYRSNPLSAELLGSEGCPESHYYSPSCLSELYGVLSDSDQRRRVKENGFNRRRRKDLKSSG